MSYGISGNKIYNCEDGTIIDLDEIKKVKEQKAINNFNESMSELIDLGLSPDLIIVKYRNKEFNCINIKRDFEFNKEFRFELRDIMLSKELSKNARCFIGTLTPFISFPSNAIHINYKNPTFNELMEILDMSKNILSDTLKELQNNNIILRHKINGQMVIYFNPFLYCSGYCVEQSTFQMFKSSIYNPVKNDI